MSGRPRDLVRYLERVRPPLPSDEQVASLHARVLEAVRKERPVSLWSRRWLYAVPAVAAAVCVLALYALLAPRGEREPLPAATADAVGIAFELVAESPAFLEEESYERPELPDIRAGSVLPSLSDEELELVAARILQMGRS